MKFRLARLMVPSLLALWDCGCRSSADSIRPEDEAKVWQIALTTSSSQRMEMKGGAWQGQRRLVVPYTLAIEDARKAAEIRGAISFKQSDLSKETSVSIEDLNRLVDGLLATSSKAVQIGSGSVASTDADLASGDVTEQLRRGARVVCKPCDWQSALTKHPGHGDITWLSRSAFVKDLALVYSESTCEGEGCFQSLLFLLEKQNGKWTMRKVITVGIS
jgi:hypothetical protein